LGTDGGVTGLDRGAMGIHYVNGTLPGETQLDASKPQALIYEPVNGQAAPGRRGIYRRRGNLAGRQRQHHAVVLDGQVFQFVDAPNRFNIPSFFELHVRARRDNPQGTFVDRNNHVSCERQSIDQMDQ
jgi:hypothetical protein